MIKYKIMITLPISLLFTLSVYKNNMDWYMYILTLFIFPLIVWLTLNYCLKKINTNE